MICIRPFTKRPTIEMHYNDLMSRIIYNIYIFYFHIHCWLKSRQSLRYFLLRIISYFLSQNLQRFWSDAK